MTNRLRTGVWAAAGVVAGLAVGGVAYAVVVAPDNAGDKYYACVSSVGVVKASTIKLNAPPASCPAASDVVHSWAAVGPTGASGATGATGPAAPGPRSSTIQMSDSDFAINGAGSGPILGPVNTAECRSINVHWTSTGSALDGVYVYDVDPQSGDRTPSLPYSMGWGPSAAVGPGATTGSHVAHVATSVLTSSSSTLIPIAGGFGDMLDLGGAVGPLTSVQFALSYTGNATVQRVWLTCVPWT